METEGGGGGVGDHAKLLSGFNFNFYQIHHHPPVLTFTNFN